VEGERRRRNRKRKKNGEKTKDECTCARGRERWVENRGEISNISQDHFFDVQNFSNVKIF
jgi:hypothetical protein